MKQTKNLEFFSLLELSFTTTSKDEVENGNKKKKKISFLIKKIMNIKQYQVYNFKKKNKIWGVFDQVS